MEFSPSGRGFVSQCTVCFHAFSVIFFSMTHPRPRKSRDPKEQMRPRLTWRRTTHRTKTGGNIFLFAYAYGTVVETCVSEGFRQMGGLNVSGYSAGAERFFANCSGFEINLRSGSIFVRFGNLHSGGQGETKIDFWR